MESFARREVVGLDTSLIAWFMLGNSVLGSLIVCCLFFMVLLAWFSEDLRVCPLILAVDRSDVFKLRLLYGTFL